jgi:hypothetical protein
MNRENLARSLRPAEVEALRQEAWIGDAVLELYARTRILDEEHRRNTPRLIRFVRNAFLNHLGQPTRVEAEIGQRYASGGLDAAFAWIREHIEPLFLKQEANLARRLKQAPKRQRSRRR